jgi:hypothetical protein
VWVFCNVCVFEDFVIMCVCVCFVMCVFVRVNVYFTLTEVFRAFSSVVRQMPG